MACGVALMRLMPGGVALRRLMPGGVALRRLMPGGVALRRLMPGGVALRRLKADSGDKDLRLLFQCPWYQYDDVQHKSTDRMKYRSKFFNQTILLIGIGNAQFADERSSYVKTFIFMWRRVAG